jgi:hypothetical protein
MRTRSLATPSTEVRALYVAEFARLKIGAKVGSYLAVLTQSNVRGMLRRKTLAAEAARTTADLSPGPEDAIEPQQDRRTQSSTPRPMRRPR